MKPFFIFHETTSPSRSFVLPNLVIGLDHQNFTFCTTLLSPISPIELITELVPIEPIPESMTTKSPAPNSSFHISTQPL